MDMHSIDASHKNYIRVTALSVFDKPAALAAMADLINHPEYPVKHSLWDFSNATMGLTLMDLKEIVGVMRLYKPPKAFANRSAILVSGTMESALAKVFIGMSSLLPFAYRTFNTFEDAEEYLTSD